MSLLSAMVPSHHRARIGRALAATLVALLLAAVTAGSAQARAKTPTPAPAKSTSKAGAPGQRATFGIGPATPIDRRGYFSYATGVGGSYDDRAAVLNYGKKPLVLGVYSADLSNGNNGNIVVGLQNQTARDAGAWITLPTKLATVRVPAAGAKGPGRVVIPFHLAVPSSAEPGDHAASIVAVLSTVGKNPKGQNVRLDQRVATRIYIRVSGALHPALTVEHLRATYNGTWNPVGRGRATVTYTVHNTGNVRLGASQLVSVSGMFGTTSKVIVPSKIQLLFPGASQSFTVRVPGVLPTIWQKTHVTVTPLLFQDQQPMAVAKVRASTSFYAVPWTLLALVLLLIVVLGGLFFLRRKRRKGPKLTPAGPARQTGHRAKDSSRSTRRDPAGVASRVAVGTAMVGSALLALAVAPTSALAASVPFSDPNAAGYIGLCDSSGHQVTSGSITAKPFIARAVSTYAAPAQYSFKKGGKATLYAFQPRNGVDPGDWSGRQLTASSFFSNDAHPMAEGTNLDYSLADWLSIYAAKWDGLVQLRMFLGAPNTTTLITPYAAVVLRVSGTTWTVVQGGKVDCSAGKVRSTERVYLPKSRFTSASASAAASAAASGAPGSSKSSHSTGSGTSSAPVGGSSAPSGSSGTNGAGQAGSTPTTSDVAASTKASSSDGSSAPAIGAVVIVVLAGAGFAFYYRRRRAY